MKLKSIFIILLSALSLAAFAQQPQKKVAVYVTGEQTDIKKVLADKVVDEFTKNSRFIAIERTASFLAEISKEQGYQRTGIVSDKEIARLGVQFGVQFVCVIDVADVFGEKHISSRLIDVETAQIINSHSISGQVNNMADLQKIATQIAKEISSKTIDELLAIENKIINEVIRDEYIILGKYMVASFSSESYNYETAYKLKDKCTNGGFSDWKIPKSFEIEYICNKMDEIVTFLIDYRRKLERKSKCESFLGRYTTTNYYGQLVSCSWVWGLNDGTYNMVLYDAKDHSWIYDKQGISYKGHLFFIRDMNEKKSVKQYNSSQSNENNKPCDYNTALARMLNDDYDEAQKILNCITNKDAKTYYLAAVLAARTGNEEQVYSNLTECVKLDASYKSKARNDAEFTHYKKNQKFQEIVN